MTARQSTKRKQSRTKKNQDKTYRVTKLVKPSSRSTHPSRGHFHAFKHHVPPQECKAGDTIFFSVRYRAPDKNVRSPMAVARYVDSKGGAETKRLRIKKDNQWHEIKVAVKVTRDSMVRPEIIWPYGRDMTLYVADCRIEKRAADYIGPSKLIRLLHKYKLKKDVEQKPYHPVIRPMRSGLDFSMIPGYFSKTLAPRSFSFTSMPRFIIIPALFMSLLLFRRWKAEQSYEKLLLPVLTWVYLIIYILRTSHGRYLLPAVPLIILLFVFFLLEGLKEKKMARNALLTSFLFTLAAMVMIPNYPLIKLGLSLFFLTGLWLLYFKEHANHYRNGALHDLVRLAESPFGRPLTLQSFVITLCLVSFLVFLGTSWANARQIGRYVNWGYNNEMGKISMQFKKKEAIWINFDRGLIQFYRHNGRYTPFNEGKKTWGLQEWVPKAKLLERTPFYFTYDFEWEDAESFRDYLETLGIEKVALLVSTHVNDQYRFPFQDKLPEMQRMDFLEQLDVVKLKRKSLYIFKVRDP